MTTVPKSKHKEIEYPWIGISTRNRLIVLFESKGKGTILRSVETDGPVGTYSDIWDMDMFEEFQDEIILEN